jgi:hypothetical protein
MIALNQEQLDGHSSVESEFGRAGLDRHSILDGCGARWQQAVGAGKLHEANAAGSDRAEALQIAQGRNLLAICAGCVKNRLPFLRCDQLTVDSN